MIPGPYRRWPDRGPLLFGQMGPLRHPKALQGSIAKACGAASPVRDPSSVRRGVGDPDFVNCGLVNSVTVSSA